MIDGVNEKVLYTIMNTVVLIGNGWIVLYIIDRLVSLDGSVCDSTINEGSCQSKESCRYVQNSTIHDGSCQGYQSCKTVKNSIIGKGSCTGINGNSCDHSENITIGNNSCNGGLTKNNTATNVCEKCAHNVPNNACNQGSTDDMTDGRCNFCG